MRILQIAPPWEPTPPPAYGGTELVVSLLTEELVRRGHDVTLAAPGDSRTSARLLAPYPQNLRSLVETIPAPETIDWLHTAVALREAAGGYDIVHNHSGELAMLFGALVRGPMLTTIHGVPGPVFEQVLGFYPGYFNCISRSHARSFPAEGGAGVVLHGIDVDTFPFQTEREDYLLYLSRISPEKGPLEAIAVARRLGMRLIIAGKVSHLDREFHEREVAPLIDGNQIVFLGEADYAMKRRLYRAARCVLMPLQWDEPFGLVMVEAMACGAPVVALRRGSAPELIVDGKTGFLTDDVDGMVEAVRRIDAIRPEVCRRHVELHFSVERMTDDYLALYDRLMRCGPRTTEAPAA
ncbi:MAG: glycosyltransferase family 4 protein [Chloroflexi bacterium]|nr:glycosyltransferase family 4 protein [Chloroflexota bacterium]